MKLLYLKQKDNGGIIDLEVCRFTLKPLGLKVPIFQALTGISGKIYTGTQNDIP
jgi:hypothetical protein